MSITSQFVDMMLSSTFFEIAVLIFVNFSYWSKFHVSIITGYGVMIIFAYKGLTRNPEIRNQSEFCTISRDLTFDLSREILLQIDSFQIELYSSKTILIDVFFCR